MNYYNEIKETLIKNEIYKKVKDYSKNKSDLKLIFNINNGCFYQKNERKLLTFI